MGKATRYLSALFLVLLLCAATALGAAATGPEDAPLLQADEITDGDWVYSITDGEANIVRYEGTAASVTVPASAVLEGRSWQLRSMGNKAFENNEKLQRLTISEGIVTIGDQVCAGCRNLEEVTIPSTAASLGAGAFKNCALLSQVTIKGDLADCSKYSLWTGSYEGGANRHSRDYAVFYNAGANAESLTITFAQGVTRVPAYLCATAYEKGDNVHSHVTKTVLSEGVREIGAYAFYKCWDLADAKLPDTLQDVGEYAFAYNGAMETLTLGANTASLGSYSFAWDTKLRTVNFGRGTGSVGDNTFQGCTALTDLRFNDRLKTVGRYAFQDCSALEKVNIPASVSSLGDGAFKNCVLLSDVTVNGDLADCSKYSIWTGSYESGANRHSRDYAVFYNAGTNADAFVITFAGGVTRVPAYLCATAYEKGDNVHAHVTKAVLSEGVQEIGAYAFYRCWDLADAELSDTLQNVGEYAFAYNSAMETLTLGARTASLGVYSFAWDTKLRTVNFGRGSGSVGDNAFQGCTALTDLRFNDRLKTVGRYAFRECSALKEIDVPASVISLGDGAFRDCVGLSRVVINGDLADCSKYSTWTGKYESGANRHSYDYSVFYNAGTNADELVLEFAEGVTKVPAYFCATAYPQGDNVSAHVTRLVFSGTVREIGEYAFCNCFQLPDVTLGSGVETVGNYAFANSGIKTAALGSGCHTVCEGAFQGCVKLVSATLNNELETVGVMAFKDCAALRSVTIPSSVVLLDRLAFMNCTGLTEIVIDADLADCSKYSTWTGKYESGANRYSRDYSVFYNAGNGAEDLKVTFGESVTRVPAYLFATGDPEADDVFAHIDEVYLPAGLASVGSGAFANCYDLKTVQYGGADESAWRKVSVEEGNEALTAVSPRFGTEPPVARQVEIRRITVLKDGREQRSVTAGSLLVTVHIRNLASDGGLTVMLAGYGSDGRYQGLCWVSIRDFPSGAEFSVTLPVDNTDGDIAHFKAFTVASLADPTPCSQEVIF